MMHSFDEIIDRRGTDAKKYSPDVYPKDVLPMWIADTDFKCPQPIVDMVVKRAEHGIYGYPYNKNEFATAACHWLHTRFGCDVPESAIEYAPGVIPGAVYAVRAYSNPGDKVVIQSPAYPPFRDLIRNNGRQISANSMVLRDGRYEIDFADLEARLADARARVFLLCNPHNPTGRVFTGEELNRILRLCVENDVFVVSDEIHCDLLYEGRGHIPFVSLGKEAEAHACTLINPSKTFNTAGFRTAAIVAPNVAVHNRIYQQLANNKGFGRTIFGQCAFITAYTECAGYADELVVYLSENLAAVRDAFAAMPKIFLIEPEATYLLWLDCRTLHLNAQSELVDFFVKEAKVGLNDGASFGPEGDGFMRLNTACPKATLSEGLARIRAAYDKRFAN